MKAGRAYAKFGRLNSVHAAGKVAKKVWVCARPGCELHHQQTKQPDHCLACGGMVFDYFASTGEANRWASLRLQEKIGAITNLRRQVRHKLLATAPNGLQVHVADYLSDHEWDDKDGNHHTEDVKPKGGIDDLAALKIKWASAQLGRNIEIYTV